MKRLILASVVGLLLYQPQANAFGCFSGAALGGVIGHEVHHTFIGMFGGCAGGMVVHHLYVKWKKKHPDGSIKQFVADNRDKLPAGWADKLSPIGDSSIKTAPGASN